MVLLNKKRKRMTPREKANELYSKYDDLLNKDFMNPIVFDNQIKQCALIAVDEILNDVMFYWYSPTEDMPKDLAYFVTVRKYWEHVKTEIEKL